MALTEKQVKEYREKLKDGAYMEKAVNGVAGKFLEVSTPAAMLGVKLNTNNTEEKKMARLTLNDHLSESLEWLSDRSVKGDELTEEMRRAEIQCKVAQQIIANNNFILRAVIAAQESGIDLQTVKEKLNLLTG
jgi:hypothetical protein